MLKPYKDLSRWYGALEPDGGPAADARAEHGSGPDVRDDTRDGIAERATDADADATATALTTFGNDSADTAADRGVAIVPDREPPRRPTADVDPAEEARARAEVPTDLPARRSEFVGGWSDWVAGDHAPGPDDDYEPRDHGVTRFPWPEDELDDDDRDAGRGGSGGRLAPEPGLRAAARDRPGARRTRLVVALIVAVLVVAVAVAGALWLVGGGRDSARPAVQFTAGSVRTDAVVDCPTEYAPGVVRGAGTGGTDSGPAVVLAFQYGYYVERSGERVRAVVAPDAPISPASVIQRGIDSVPPGTTHCVRVLTIAEGAYEVEVTEYRPGGTPATYNRQTVTTAVIDGRTLITGIAAG